MINKKLLFLLAIPAFMYGGYMALPKGVRNNNPGNIERGDDWQGMRGIQTDKRFVQFVDAKYGIRAMARIYKSYAKRGVFTLEGIISTWAPPYKNGKPENDTEAYIKSVERITGFDRHEFIGADRYPALIAAMIKNENGIQPYSVEKIKEGVLLA